MCVKLVTLCDELVIMCDKLITMSDELVTMCVQLVIMCDARKVFDADIVIINRCMKQCNHQSTLLFQILFTSTFKTNLHSSSRS